MTHTGYVTVFEFTKASGLWQFFVGTQPVVTDDSLIADAIKLAIQTSALVQVICPEGSNDINQVRMEFAYLCEHRLNPPCDGEPVPVCEAQRYSRCDHERIHVHPG